MPKIWITKLAGWAANKEAGWLTYLAIILFVKYYKVNMKEANRSNIKSYRTFNDFFVRALRQDVRPVNTDQHVLIMPADGMISQLGKIDKDNLFQSKGHYYSLTALLAGDNTISNKFYNGSFITIYLSPRDYHRVHMPCNGTLLEMIYVPGNLFSVNNLSIQKIPNLFSRNERVICLFDTNFGLMAQILIGAIIVGSIETVWAGTIIPPRQNTIKRWRWSITAKKDVIFLKKGQEMARFKLGSTVINLFLPNRIKFTDALKNNLTIQIGQPMAISTSISF